MVNSDIILDSLQLSDQRKLRLDQGTELPLGKLGQLVDDIEVVVLDDRDGRLLDGRAKE